LAHTLDTTLTLDTFACSLPSAYRATPSGSPSDCRKSLQLLHLVAGALFGIGEGLGGCKMVQRVGEDVPA